MERIEPIPRDTTFVIVGKYPLKPFNIRLLDFISEILLVLGLYMEL